MRKFTNAGAVWLLDGKGGRLPGIFQEERGGVARVLVQRGRPCVKVMVVDLRHRRTWVPDLDAPGWTGTRGKGPDGVHAPYEELAYPEPSTAARSDWPRHELAETENDDQYVTNCAYSVLEAIELSSCDLERAHKLQTQALRAWAILLRPNEELRRAVETEYLGRPLRPPPRVHNRGRPLGLLWVPAARSCGLRGRSASARISRVRECHNSSGPGSARVWLSR